MKQRGKRVVSFLLVMALIMSFFGTIPSGVKVKAEGDGPTAADFTIKTDGNGKITIKSYNGSGYDTIDLCAIFGEDLVEISCEGYDGAFAEHDEITNITIPKSCKTIWGDDFIGAFSGCEGLESVKFESGANPVIGEGAFPDPSGHDLIFMGSSSCTNVQKYVKNAQSNNSDSRMKFQIYAKTISVEATKKYYQFQKDEDEALDLTTINVTGKDLDGNDIKTSAKDCVITDFDKDTLGEQVIAVSYGGQNATFNVWVRVNLDDDDGEWNLTVNDGQIYTGKEIKPSVKLVVYDSNFNKKELNEEQYTLGYENNINADEDISQYDDFSESHPYVVVSGDGVYTVGKTKKNFRIKKAKLEDTNVIVDSGAIYSGEGKTPEVTVKFNGKTVEKDQYEVIYADNEKAGEAAVIIDAEDNGNFTGTKTTSFTIAPLDLKEKSANVKVEVTQNAVYNGGTVTPTILVTADPNNSGKDTTLEEGVDYTVNYSNNIEPGTGGEYTITGKGNYTGRLTGKFEIEKCPLDSDIISATALSQYYDGTEKNPEVTVTMSSNGKITKLKEGEDYKISSIERETTSGDAVTKEKVEAPVEVGDYIVTLEGIGEHFTDTTTFNYSIVGIPLYVEGKDSTNAVIADIPAKTYQEEGCKPQVTVTKNGTVLKEGVDYKVTYLNNMQASSDTMKASVVVMGIGKYSGTLTKYFTINQAPLFVAEGASGNAVIAPIGDQTYVEGGCRPSVTVTKNGKTLEQNKDYTLQYQNNNGKGTATVIVYGTGNYSGSITANFTIIGKDTDPTNPSNPGGTTTTDPSNPGGTTTNPTNPSNPGGTTTTDPSNPGGTTTNPSNPGGTATTPTTPAAPSTPAAPATPAAPSASAAPATTEAATTASVSKPGKAKLSSVKSSKAKKLTVKWASVKNTEQYEVSYSVNKNFKKAKKVKTTKTSVTIKGLKKGKKYYVRVRAKNAAGWGAYSKSKTVKIKK